MGSSSEAIGVYGDSRTHASKARQIKHWIRVTRKKALGHLERMKEKKLGLVELGDDPFIVEGARPSRWA